MLENYFEEWRIKIGKEEIVIDGEEKKLLERAMKANQRWFTTKKGEVLSINHIETVLLMAREKREKNISLPFPSAVPSERERETWGKWKDILKRKVEGVEKDGV